jgi:hypothetical protein
MGSECAQRRTITKNVRLGRCFQCQSYSGHTACFCRGQTKCGWCAASGHTLDTCPDRQNPNKKACAPCGGKRVYCALDKHCPARLREEERAKAAYDSRPAKFDVPSLRSSAPQKEARAARLTQDQTEEPEDEGFLVVGSKRRRGRPTAISTASTGGIPNIASSLASLESSQEALSSPSEEEMVGSPSL